MEYITKIFAAFGWFPESNRRHRQTIEKLEVLNKIQSTGSWGSTQDAAKKKILELIEGMD